MRVAYHSSFTARAGVFCCNSVGAHTMHPSVLYHHTTALSYKAHHVIAPFYGQPLPICRVRCSPLSEKRNKNAVFLHIRERQHSSLSVQIFAVAGNHIFIPSKELFPVPCLRPVRVPGKAPVILPGFILPVRPLGR